MAEKTILVVDDEENLRELVKAILEQENYKVITAYDGNDCLNKLKTLKPDLIILDMFMPRMSGRATCERIRANPKTRNLKIIFLTVSRFSEAGIDAIKKLKVLDYITKPFDNKDLVRRVKKAL